ncbi:MAG: hypothetical protein FWD33_04175 [Alphaproteobacteria bacterium]|nr:hypothetical protein [Alphaproteobacteria bacterium]
MIHCRIFYSIEIAAPIGKIFDVITDSNFTPKWVPVVVSETRIGPMQIGAVLTSQLTNGESIEMTVDKLQFPTEFGLAIGEWHEEYQLSPINENLTKIRIAEWEGDENDVYGGLPTKLAALKRLIEQGKGWNE